jgi:hypothetical protein
MITKEKKKEYAGRYYLNEGLTLCQKCPYKIHNKTFILKGECS